MVGKVRFELTHFMTPSHEPSPLGHFPMFACAPALRNKFQRSQESNLLRVLVGTPRIELDSLAFQTSAMTTLARCPTSSSRAVPAWYKWRTVQRDLHAASRPASSLLPCDLPSSSNTSKLGGCDRLRTRDLLGANEALSQSELRTHYSNFGAEQQDRTAVSGSTGPRLNHSASPAMKITCHNLYPSTIYNG